MRFLRGILLVVLALSLVVASGGFTSVTADRNVHVEVASDENAFLGLETDGIDRCGNHREFYRVTNQFGTIELTEIRASVVGTDGVRASVQDTPDQLDPGESDYIEIEVKPIQSEGSDTEPGSVTVHIEAIGDGTDVSLERTVEADCAKSDPSQSSGSTSTATSTGTPQATATPQPTATPTSN